jgi:hypothetical protein
VISVKPFEEKHILEASQMFTAKYRALQHENDLLPTEFQGEVVIQAMLESTIREHPGVVAIQRRQ